MVFHLDKNESSVHSNCLKLNCSAVLCQASEQSYEYYGVSFNSTTVTVTSDHLQMVVDPEEH